MKKFKDLRIGDFVYECNFKRDEFKKYEIVNIEDSIYKNQALELSDILYMYLSLCIDIHYH